MVLTSPTTMEVEDDETVNPLGLKEIEEEKVESDKGEVNLGGLSGNEGHEELVLSAPLDIPVALPAHIPSEKPQKGPTSEGLFLREWGPLNNLLSKIPTKAQKGLATLDLKLTCIAAVADFLVLGTNVGLVYWYNRTLDVLDRLKTQNTNCPISTVSVVSSVDYMLAAGNNDGLITIFQIAKNSGFNLNNNRPDIPNRPRKTQIFTVSDLHNSIITALEWSSNGMKLFSGNATGSVVVTDIDYDLGIIKSQNLLEEKYEIIQLSYARKHLLVCSTLRSIVYSLETVSVYKVGTQDRKMPGRYGGIFQNSSFNENPKLLSVRPGGRIWVADLNGMVEHTIKFKDLLSENQHPFIPVINPSSSTVKTRFQDFQLGVLYRFMHSYVATHHKDILFILDPVNTRILGVCQELKSVVDIAVNESEIFVLESDRNIIRVSSVPDKQSTFNNSTEFLKGVGMIPNIMSASISDFRLPQEPINYLTTKLKETSRALPKINSALLNTLKNVIEVDMDIQDGQLNVVPPVIPLRESEIPNIVLETESPPMLLKDRFGHISNQPYDDVILQPIKKKRKRKIKKPDTIFLSSGDTISISSAYSTNSEGDVTTGVFRRLSSQSDSAQSSQSASTSSEPSKANVDLQKILPCMSRSWTVGNLISQEVSLPDLETKEEILARKLNWPELLPESARENFVNPIKSSGNFKREENHHPVPSRWEFGSRDTLDETGDDGGSSILTLRDVYSSDLDTDENNCTSGLGISSMVSSSFVEENNEDDLEYDNPTADENSLSNIFDQSIDIYAKYAPQDSQEESQSGSQVSALSFGPPSGSSFAVNENRSLGDIVENQIFVIDENLSPETTNCKLVEVQDMMVDPVVIGNDAWLSYKAPASLQSVSGCDSYVVCTDTKNNVYYSRLGELSIRWIQMEYQASHLAISSCSSVVWRLFKGTLYSLMNPIPEGPIGSQGTEWSKLCTNVASMAVKKHVGWIVKTDGSVYICCGLLESAVVPDFEKVDCPWSISQLSVLDNLVWAITMDGRVVYRVGITEMSCKGVEWFEKNWEQPILPANTVCIGPGNSVWIADVHDNLYFVSGVSEHCYAGMSYPWKVSFGDYTFYNGNGNGNSGSSSGSVTSWRTKLSDSLRPDRISSLLSSRASPILFGFGSSIWYSASGSSNIQVNKTQAEGHGWTSIKLNRLVKGTTWSAIFAGSIYKEHGYLWLSDSKGKLFYCPPRGGELRPVDLPCSTELVSISPAPDALWILNREGIVHGRCNISSINPIGHGWDKIDLSPLLVSVHLVHVSCGSDVAWACDNKGNIYMRLGSLRPTGPNDMSPAWVQVDGSPMQIKNCLFTKVYVGSSGSMIWALDNCKNIYVREAVYPDYPIGIRWLLVSGIEAIRLAVSEEAVWALTPKGEIFRRYGISATNFVGDYWKKVPGTAKILTVSLCDEVWALDTFGQLTKHSQEILNFKDRNKREKPPVVLDPEDKDWEFVDSL